MLPECHSRRDLPGESRVFFCAHPRHHSKDNLVTAGSCMICTLWQLPAPETFRKFPPEPPPKPRGPCRHLGEQVGLRECPSCRGTVKLKVFACGHPNHQETTLQECTQCQDHQEIED